MQRTTTTGVRLGAIVAVTALLASCGGSSGSATDSTPRVASAATSSPDPTIAPTSAPAATDGAPAATAATQPTTTDPQTTDAETTVVSATDAETTGPAATGPLTVQQLLDLGRPIVLAHAAGENEHPHSTPYGYAKSVAAGVDMLDFDVQLTADGELVVQHDDTTGRTTNQDLVVADTDYADLALLDNAYWFTADCTCTGQPDAAYILRGMRTGAVPPLPGYSPDDFAIARFEDMVRRFPTMPLNIEIKGTGAPAVAAAYELARILTDNERLSNAVVTSFDDIVVAAFQELAPTVEVTPGLNLSSAFVLNGTPLPDGMRILQLPVQFGDIEVLTPETIAASHDAGYVIWVWPDDRTWENPDGYAKLLEMGLDGLNINVPDEGVAAVRALFG